MIGKESKRAAKRHGHAYMRADNPASAGCVFAHFSISQAATHPHTANFA